MPTSLPVGQTGTLQFMSGQAGIPESEIESVSWQPQGSQQHVKFTPPDKVEGISIGTGSYKATVTKKTPGEKYTFPFDITCVAPMGTLTVIPPVNVVITPPPVEPPGLMR